MEKSILFAAVTPVPSQSKSKNAKLPTKSITSKTFRSQSTWSRNKLITWQLLGWTNFKRFSFHKLQLFSTKISERSLTALNHRKTFHNIHADPFTLTLRTGKSAHTKEQSSSSTSKKRKAKRKSSDGLLKSLSLQGLSWESVFLLLLWSLKLFLSHMLKLLEQHPFCLIV